MSLCQSRRRLTFSLVCSLVAFAGVGNVTLRAGAEQKDALVDPSSKVRIEWQVKEDQADEIKKVLPLAQTATSGTRNPLIIGALIFVGVAMVPEVAQAVIDVYYRYKSGGVIIDARGEPIIVQTSDRMAPGYALIITADGAKIMQIGGAQKITPNGLSDLLAAAVRK